MAQRGRQQCRGRCREGQAAQVKRECAWQALPDRHRADSTRIASSRCTDIVGGAQTAAQWQGGRGVGKSVRDEGSKKAEGGLTRVHQSLPQSLRTRHLDAEAAEFENTTYNDFHFQPARSWLSGSARLDTIYNLFSLFALKSQAISSRLAGQLPVKLSVRQPCLSHLPNWVMA